MASKLASSETALALYLKYARMVLDGQDEFAQSLNHLKIRELSLVVTQKNCYKDLDFEFELQGAEMADSKLMDFPARCWLQESLVTCSIED